MEVEGCLLNWKKLRKKWEVVRLDFGRWRRVGFGEEKTRDDRIL